MSESTPTADEVGDLLHEARELMNNSGAHWTKGYYESPIVEDGWITGHKYCSLGAIRKLTDGEDRPAYQLRRAAVIALGNDERIRAYKSPQASGDYDIAWSRVLHWNDAPERTWEEVEQVFRETEERVRASS